MARWLPLIDQGCHYFETAKMMLNVFKCCLCAAKVVEVQDFIPLVITVHNDGFEGET